MTVASRLLATAALFTAVASTYVHAPAASAQEATPSCTAQMQLRGFTTQADAKRFGRECLVKQGATTQTMTAAQVRTMLEPLLGADHALTDTVPSDIAVFCPPYERLSRMDRALVWRTMLTTMARPESNYKTAEAYWEIRQKQYSVGLLQLSLADEGAYNCGLRTEVDLTRPDVNLRCAVKIMAKLVAGNGSDKRVGGDAGHVTKGAAAYWSTLKQVKTTQPGAPPAGARSEVIKEVRALPVCR